MSSPFYGLTPVYLPFSGTTDANGNLTLTLQPRIGFWFTGKVVVRAALGSPVVQVSDGAIPLAVGRGQRAEMAGIVAPPGANLLLDVIGAAAATAITGSLQGVQGPDMQSIAQAFVMTPNTVAADISSPTILQTIAGGAGSLAAPQTVAAPKGTIAVGYSTEPNSGGFANLTAITIVGGQTGIVYVNHAANFQQTPFAVPFDPADTTVIVNVTVNVATNTRPAVDVLFWQTAESVFVQTIPGGPSLSVTVPGTVDVSDRLARLVGRIVMRDTFGNEPSIAAGSLQVQEGNLPPRWQSPTGVQNFVATVAAGGTLSLVTGVGGLTVYVHTYECAFDANAATTLQLRETGGPQVFGEFDASTNSQKWGSDAKGKATAVGKGLELFNAGANPCLPVGVVYFSGPV